MMYKITHGSVQNLSDVQAFLVTLNSLEFNEMPPARNLFDDREPLYVARAPGRLDVMGGIADYSGSLVLQLPIREATLVALQKSEERTVRIVSLNADGSTRAPDFEMPLAQFESEGKPVEYEFARRFFARDPYRQWAAYVAGAFLALMRERNVTFKQGARILISSNIPEGKGVSSSAALEVATMQAICAAYDIKLEPRPMALLCQKVENHIVGAPCGVMDQMAAACGQAGKMLVLLCQPAQIQGHVAVPDDITFWGVDSGIRHVVSGSDYTSVRVGAFMGRKILETETEVGAGCAHLVNLTPSQFQSVEERLPLKMSGDAFLKKYGETDDTATKVDPAREYAVRIPTAHPVHEHFRTRLFAELLNGFVAERRLEVLGELMRQSHLSYSACGLASDGTDALAWPLAGVAGQRVYGAKITGGGSGGTVAFLTRRGADALIEKVAGDYERRRGIKPYVFTGSSPGAAAFGYMKLELEK